MLFFLKSTLLCQVNFEKGCRPTPGRVLFIFGMNISISSQLYWRVSKRDSTSLKTVEIKIMGFLLATFYVALFAVNVGYQILRNEGNENFVEAEAGSDIDECEGDETFVEVEPG